ncbi:ATP-binding protein [Solibacillus cecembensis]|uniref:ATP-binding protein n=1 Tax=Solibacillus cecembensis TaxID=459347 RepID=UPI003D0801F8
MQSDDKLLEIHPLIQRNYCACSRQIADAAALIYSWVEMAIPGAIIYAKPRMGKSRLIQFIQENFSLDFGKNIPIYSIEWTSHSPKENTFFEILLDKFNHDIPFEGRAIEKRKRLRNHIITIVSESKQNKIIIFIDEAHRLKKLEYEWLLDTYNDLERHGIILITFLVAEDKILRTFNELRAKKEMQIIGRFMTETYRFTGLMQINDFKFLLNEFDNNLKFPQDSDLTYTKFFFKEQYEQGFRLSNYLNQLIEALKFIQYKYNISEYKEVPGMYAVRCIEEILKTHGRFGTNVNELNTQHWINALESCGYISGSNSVDNEKVIDASYRKDL